MNELLLKNYFTLFKGTASEIDIYYYAICIVLGMVAAALCAIPLFKRRGFKPELILDVMIAVIPLSIIFARTWYVVMDLDQFRINGAFSFRLALQFRDGGMAIHGGILGGAIGLSIIAWIKKIHVGRLCDLGAVLLPLGQAIGRLGNYFNQEVYGRVTDITWFPYATFIEKTGHYHVALCFHEMFFNLLVFAVLYTFLMKYNGKRNGYGVGFYLLFYGIIRAVMEPMRDAEFNMGNSEPILGVPAMTWISILIIIGALGLLAYLFTCDIKEKNYWWIDLFKNLFKKKEQLADDKALETAGASAENASAENASAENVSAENASAQGEGVSQEIQEAQAIEAQINDAQSGGVYNEPQAEENQTEQAQISNGNDETLKND